MEAKTARVKKTIIIDVRVDKNLVPQGRKEVIRVRVSSLSIVSRAPERRVHLILMLLKVDKVVVPILVVLVFLVGSWATNWWLVLKRKC